MSSTESEKRGFTRFSKNFGLTFHEIDLYQELSLSRKKASELSAQTVNISAGGALIESTKTYPEKTLLNLTLDMPEWEKYKNSFFSSRIVLPCPPLSVTAQVVRNEHAPSACKRFAVRFVGMDPIRQKAIDNMLKDFSKRANG